MQFQYYSVIITIFRNANFKLLLSCNLSGEVQVSRLCFSTSKRFDLQGKYVVFDCLPCLQKSSTFIQKNVLNLFLLNVHPLLPVFVSSCSQGHLPSWLLINAGLVQVLEFLESARI